MSKSRMVWEAMKRDAEGEIREEGLGVRSARRGRHRDYSQHYSGRLFVAPGDEEELRETLLSSQIDLAGMASVLLREES